LPGVVYPPHKTFGTTPKPEFTPPVPGEDDTPTTTNWPESFEVQPVETEVPEEGEDDDGSGPIWKSPCKLWFFTVSYLPVCHALGSYTNII
jgi:hypothetical protein